LAGLGAQPGEAVCQERSVSALDLAYQHLRPVAQHYRPAPRRGPRPLTEQAAPAGPQPVWEPTEPRPAGNGRAGPFPVEPRLLSPAIGLRLRQKYLLPLARQCRMDVGIDHLDCFLEVGQFANVAARPSLMERRLPDIGGHHGSADSVADPWLARMPLPPPPPPLPFAGPPRTRT